MSDHLRADWEQTQAELLARIERLEALNELAADFYWELDSDNRFVWVSDSFATFLDSIGTLYLGHSIIEVMDRFTDKGGQLEGWDELLQSLENIEGHSDICVSAESEEMGRIDSAISGTPIFDKQGQYCGIRGAATDISKRVKAEQDLLTKSIVFERMNDGVSIVSHDGVIIDTNPAYEEIFGLQPGQAIGMTRKTLQREFQISTAKSDELRD